MNCTKAVVKLTSLFILFFFVVVIGTLYSQHLLPKANAQQIPTNSTQPPSNSTKIRAVNITSPTKGQQVPIGKDLVISGTSFDNATSHCQVSLRVNNVKSYQLATPAGPGGTNDYSKWTFTLTSNYTTLNEGPNNRILAKYTCIDPPTVPSFRSVNITGVSMAANTSSSTPQQEQQQPQNMTADNGQEQQPQNMTAGSSLAVPAQKGVSCDPNDRHVNAIESRNCGLPEGHRGK